MHAEYYDAVTFIAHCRDMPLLLSLLWCEGLTPGMADPGGTVPKRWARTPQRACITMWLRSGDAPELACNLTFLHARLAGAQQLARCVHQTRKRGR